MATKIIAIISIISLLTLCMLGNYWYTFGLWPRSWTAFFGFWLVSMLLTSMLTYVSNKEA